MMSTFAARLVVVAVTVANVAALNLAKPDPKASYKDAMACSSLVTSLSTKLQTLLSQNQNIDRTCSNSKKYYKDMIGFRQKSITHLKTMTTRHDSSDELRSEYTESYTTMMCMKTYDAFIGDKDEDDRLGVLHLCMGRKSLAPSSLLRHTSRVDHSVAGETRDCPQAKSMQDKVKLLEDMKKQKIAQCSVDKIKLKEELAEVGTEEDKLEAEVHGHHESKTDIRSTVASEVTTKFCAVITPNYKVNEQKIADFWHKECPA